jgi:hypothetical protein
VTVGGRDVKRRSECSRLTFRSTWEGGAEGGVKVEEGLKKLFEVDDEILSALKEASGKGVI